MTDQQEKTVCSTFGGGAYQQALNNLEKDYEASFGYNKQRKIFEEFTRKFTTIPEIWIKWFELEADYNRKHRIDDLRKQALTHFYSLDFIGFLRPDTTIVKEFSKLIEWPYLDILRFKCYHINPSTLAEGLALAEKALTFPHWKLEEIYKIYSTSL
uniref:Uncharacterized protein n=1 Tax=Panagrolaimus sp. ES5 TaxID=591445 RepID=A0AC34GD14_9BILA